jgi:hypothetical protein
VILHQTVTRRWFGGLLLCSRRQIAGEQP